jgi:hypothetical protein
MDPAKDTQPIRPIVLRPRLAAPPAPDVQLGADARELLLAAAGPTGAGCILLALAGRHSSCAAGGRQFIAGDSAAEAERWRAAVEELIRAALVRPVERGGCLYRVRSAGYDLAGRLG